MCTLTVNAASLRITTKGYFQIRERRKYTGRQENPVVSRFRALAQSEDSSPSGVTLQPEPYLTKIVLQASLNFKEALFWGRLGRAERRVVGGLAKN